MSTETLRQVLTARGWTEQDWTRHGEPGWKVDGPWEVSPARYIEDRQEWQALKFDVRDLLAPGTTVTAHDGDEAHTGTVQDYEAGVGRVLIRFPDIDFTMAIPTDRLVHMLDDIEIHS